MITNFENITSELNEEEMQIIPIMVKAFSKHTIENPIKAPEIIKLFNANKQKFGFSKNLTEPRLRKICNYIRSNGIIPLIATSDGYYTSFDNDKISKQIYSLRERANSINRSAAGLERFLQANKTPSIFNEKGISA